MYFCKGGPLQNLKIRLKIQNLTHFDLQKLATMKQTNVAYGCTDPILFSSLHLMITKAHIRFQPSVISSFQEKVEVTDRQKNVAYYNIGA